MSEHDTRWKSDIAEEEGASRSHDPVVAALLAKGVIPAQDLAAVVVATGNPTVSWRELVEHPGVNRDAVFAEAAAQKGIQTQEIDGYTPPDDLVRSILGLFEEEISAEVLRRGLLPVEILTDPSLVDFTIALASNDPLHPAHRDLLGNLGVNIVLRYAPESVVRERILSTGIVDESEYGHFHAATADPLPVLDAGVASWLDESEVGSAEIAGIVPELSSASAEEAATQSDPVEHLADLGVFEDLGDVVEANDAPDPAAESAESVSPSSDTGAESAVDLEVHEQPVDEVGANSTSKKEKQSPPTASTDMYDLDKIHGALRDRVVGMLVHKQFVTQQQVVAAMEVQKQNPREALWRLLADIKGIDRDVVFREAASVYAFRTAELSDPDPKFAKLVMEAFPEAKRNELLSMKLFPVEYEMDSATGGAKLVFVTHDPARPEIHRLLQQLKVGRFQLYYTPESEVTDLIHLAFPRRNEFLDRMTDDPMAMDLGQSFEEEGELIDESALEAEISRSTLINLFEATLLEATRKGASDIHVFPNPRRQVEIHFRVDGRLFRWHVEDKVHPEAFLAVVKDNSKNVDRFERDAAQDGFIQRRIDDALIRYRVSVLPIATASQELRAESIVIRVLDDRKVMTDLRKLGMLDVALEKFNQAIHQPHGMVILTGPTGSGKSTTLVAALHQVVTPEINVLTVEDPVEYIIQGVRQIKLNSKLNLDQALRAILRHDPDVVMVGEMRDKATADLAIKLANTGHLAFSTLHTNDAPSAVSRLYKMGVEPFLIAYAINLVVAQRLIRTLCPSCKVVDDDSDPLLSKRVGFTDADLAEYTFYKAGTTRCKNCGGTGYKGRRALCETLYFSRAIRHLILESAESIDEDAIRTQASKEGMLSLQDSAREIVKQGETSLDELIRVTAVE
jgi:type IV pilus assembly protein PilB